ncbi:hypothetical protein RFI_29058 [Reticulomyxa filosa]|uniref:Uncharacterized protein n=1 Tax=Reticulomyxa filosa TaxID=46433 RepID=X6M306_RETFI|nr:hypothetical protein RFI_29058 [Reticulomyxa filosa]|eukprot:ETO08329.1 hypothetical protein RFI_29058 [Reticulomyxa filosa]
MKDDLFYIHSHHTTHAIREQRAKTFVDKDNPASSDNGSSSGWNGSNGQDLSGYYNIAENIDGGILSNWIFLPFNQWCNANIEFHTSQADQLLNQMKKESQNLTSKPLFFFFLEQHRRQAKTDDDIIITNKSQPKVMANAQLSYIDGQLSLEGEKLRNLLKVQGHVKSIQAQFDTFIDSLRQRQIEILELSKELKERHQICTQTLQCLSDHEIWLVQNIADTIAERAEKIDRMNKRLKQHATGHEQKTTETQGKPLEDRDSVEAELMHTRAFVDHLHQVIVELQQINDNKRQEVNAIKNDIEILRAQNVKIGEASSNAAVIAMERLFGVQSHYQMPTLVKVERKCLEYVFFKKKKGATEVTLRSQSILQSMDTYLSNAVSRDAYSRAMELWQCCVIFSNNRNKTFFNEYLPFFSLEERGKKIENRNKKSDFGKKENKWLPLGGRLMHTTRTSMTEHDLPVMTNIFKESEKMFELIKQSQKLGFKGLDLLMNLSEVCCREINHDADYKENKETYNPAVRPFMTSHYLSGKCVVHVNDNEPVNKQIETQKTHLDNLLDRVFIFAKYGDKIHNLETVLSCVGQYVTLQFQHG